MVILAASPGGWIVAIAVLYIFGLIFATGYFYARNMLDNAEAVRESHPSLSRSLRRLGWLYMSVCYIFIASVITAGITLIVSTIVWVIRNYPAISAS